MIQSEAVRTTWAQCAIANPAKLPTFCFGKADSWGREETLEKHARQAGLSFMFASGKRPSADDIERLLARADCAAAAASISFRPHDDGDGWVELLVSGLTFDLCGLASGKAMPAPVKEHCFGLASDHAGQALEAITIYPADHIAGGFAMIPVVQAMLGLAGHIALPLMAEAVCWHPAGSWMEPQYFSQIALNWLSGGAFPALGLTALRENPQGVRSEGLDFFVNQELQVNRRDGEETVQTAKLALRLVNDIVCNGAFMDETAFEGPDGEDLHVELAQSGRLAIVRRQA